MQRTCRNIYTLMIAICFTEIAIYGKFDVSLILKMCIESHKGKDMEPLRIGFLGAGGFARHTIYPALHLAPVALQAVCDADENRAKAAAGKFGTGRYYLDRHEMFEKEDLEAVIISMGPDPRQPLVLETLAAGYHVFTPKPPGPIA